MSKINKKIIALNLASQEKRKNTQLKVIAVMRVMKDKNIPINFESVAKLSGVSKTWIYRQSDLSDEITNLRNKTGKIERVIDQKNINERQDAEILNLKNKNRALKAKIKKLHQQIEALYGELYRLKQDNNK